MMKTKSYYKFFTLLLVMTAISACHSDSHEHEGHTTGEITAEITEPEYFEGTGRIVSIPPSKRNLIVKHGKIPGFMNAMTMPINVRDTTIIQGIAPGDSIRFTIESTGNSAVISEVEKIED